MPPKSPFGSSCGALVAAAAATSHGASSTAATAGLPALISVRTPLSGPPLDVGCLPSPLVSPWVVGTLEPRYAPSLGEMVGGPAA